MRLLMLTLVLVLCNAPAATAQARPYTPQRGSIEREQIMDAFRTPVTRQIGRSVVFHDVRLRVQDGWAFIVAKPRSPAGRPVLNYESSHCVPNCTDEAIALLRWSRGRWTVVAYEVSPGEFPYSWRERFPDVPRAVWP